MLRIVMEGVFQGSVPSGGGDVSPSASGGKGRDEEERGSPMLEVPVEGIKIGELNATEKIAGQTKGAMRVLDVFVVRLAGVEGQ
ncbi:hypothetical protein HK102_000831, partial [Quaeritorhiza haematococci]